MAGSHFISRLKQLHAEKMGRREQAEVQIKALEEEIEAIDRDLSHILAVARMDDPNANFASVKPIRRRNANGHSASGTRTGLKRRELPELVLSAFRDAAQPLGSADVLAQILLRKPDADPAKLKQQVYAYVSRSSTRFSGLSLGAPSAARRACTQSAIPQNTGSAVSPDVARSSP